MGSWRISKIVLIAFVLMTIMTVVYVVYVATAYASTNSRTGIGYPVCWAFEYKSGTPPSHVYTLEELGIVYVDDYGGLLGVAYKGPDLAVAQPIFRYNEKLYQVSPYHVTPGLSDSIPTRPILTLIGAVLVPTGWIIPGILYLKDRKQEQEKTG